MIVRFRRFPDPAPYRFGRHLQGVRIGKTNLGLFAQAAAVDLGEISGCGRELRDSYIQTGPVSDMWLRRRRCMLHSRVEPRPSVGTHCNPLLTPGPTVPGHRGESRLCPPSAHTGLLPFFRDAFIFLRR